MELQCQLAQDHETMTAAELSEAADAFYDKDGRPIHSSTTTSVNAIGGGGSVNFNPNASSNVSSRPSTASNSSSSSNGFTGAFNDDNNDVNVIRQRQAQKQRYNNNNGTGSSNGSRSSNSSRNNNNNNDRYASKSSPIGANGLCHFHDKFGSDACKCVSGCKRWSSHSAGKGQASRQ